MPTADLIIYGFSAINTLALIAFSFVMSNVKAKMDRLTDKDDQMYDRLTNLEIRVGQLEVLHEQNKLSTAEIQLAIERLRQSIADLKDHYDHSMQEFYQKYDLKLRE